MKNILLVIQYFVLMIAILSIAIAFFSAVYSLIRYSEFYDNKLQQPIENAREAYANKIRQLRQFVKTVGELSKNSIRKVMTIYED
jgi:hypothetical protein